MSHAVGFISSTLGKKVLMAVTGIILFGFVVGHMLGNLQIYLGAERLNHYAELLQANKPFLWTFRSVMRQVRSISLIWMAIRIRTSSWSPAMSRSGRSACFETTSMTRMS